MSNEHRTITERLTEVATRANELCNTVDDQLGVINDRLDAGTSALDAKKAEFDSKCTESIELYQNKIDSFISEDFKNYADLRYQGSLGHDEAKEMVILRHLDSETYYPVVFKHCRMLDVRVERYIHDNVHNGGILDYWVQLQNWSQGGDFTFAKQFHYFYSNIPFVGKIQAASTPYSSAIWLRGGWDYKFYISGRCSDGPTVIESSTQVVEKISDVEYFLDPITELHSSVVNKGYILGN